MTSPASSFRDLVVWQEAHQYAEKSRFYNIAEASLEELKYYLLLSSDLGYCSKTVALTQQTDKVGRLLFRFQEGARQRINNAKPNPNS